MKIKRARQILKSFADDTRLRIINLLNKSELNVSEICEVLNTTQSNMSKHLARLRLTRVVGDKRRGMNVYYYLVDPESKAYRELLNVIIIGLADLEIFKKDLEKLKGFKKRKKA